MIIQKTEKKAIQTISLIMSEGKCVVLPCDTIYGLCSLYEKGYESLKELKGRDANKPFIVLATKEIASRMASEPIDDKIMSCWPAPLTVVLNTKDGKTTGIRVPDDPWLLKLISTLDCGIYSTSVNMSGEPSLLDFKSICKVFENKVPLLVKDMEKQGNVASTIIDATKKPYTVLRQGLYDASFLIK